MQEMKSYWPAALAGVAASIYLLFRLAGSGWDPVMLAEPGDRYRYGIPGGEPGYDGQFAYYIAINPEPDRVQKQLDVPAYRYQRILYPLLSRLLAFGIREWIPWTLILVNLTAHIIGTAIAARFLMDHSIPSGYALTYGLWVGLVAPVGLDLNEPLAYALVVGSWLCWSRDRMWLAGLLLAGALLTKETSAVFWLAMLLPELAGRRYRSAFPLVLSGGVFAIWQGWLWLEFGSLGVGSGGDMATPFEWIPFMGFVRIAGVDLRAGLLFFIIFGPTIILPSVWALILGTRKLVGDPKHGEAWALGLNGLMIALLPFSTFREPLGLVRVGTGLILAVLLLCAVENLKRPLNYSLFWSVMLVMLIRG